MNRKLRKSWIRFQDGVPSFKFFIKHLIWFGFALFLGASILFVFLARFEHWHLILVLLPDE
jgi:hypothetical protein